MSNNVFSWDQPESILSVYEEGTFESVKESSVGSHTASIYKLSEKAGEGYVEFHSIGKDISLAIFNCRWLKDTEVEIQDLNRVRLNFSLELDMLMELSRDDEITVNQPSWRIVNNRKNDIVHETYLSESKTIWVTIAITPDYICTRYGDELLSKNKELTELFVVTEERSMYREYPLDHRTSQIVGNIVSSHLDERLHLNYIQCKAAELVCIGLEKILETQDSIATPIRLRARDEKAIHLAKEILVSNLGQSPAIKEICQMIGMNRNKLHYGFKAIFGMPLSKYLQEERLAEAYKQLEETNQSILQIAANVGFRYQSSLSTAFKKKYGFSPHHVRKT